LIFKVKGQGHQVKFLGLGEGIHVALVYFIFHSSIPVTIYVGFFFLRFADDIQVMIGSPISIYWKVTWRYIAPFMISGLLLATFISKIVNPITYTAYDKDKVSIICFCIVSFIFEKLHR
jgi:hypothetical protein